MADLKRASIKIGGYKCFREQPQGIDGIGLINVIIGRNNTGKSALLDMIQFACNGPESENPVDAELGNGVVYGHRLTALDIDEAFNYFSSQMSVPIGNWHSPMDWVDALVSYTLQNGNGQILRAAMDPPLPANVPAQVAEVVRNRFGEVFRNPLQGRKFRRLLADRDIRQEKQFSDPDPVKPETRVFKVSPNGDGATNLIREYLTAADKPSEVVEVELLAALNEIFFPDGRFSRILVQQIESTVEPADRPWEIFLVEEGKGRVALSKSGSGLKTIILALVYILLLPKEVNTQPGLFVFGFEELENNLHPAMQRRLMQYLRRVCDEEKCLIFLTTHSHIAIDMFSSDEEASLYHVTHDGRSAVVTSVSHYMAHTRILDDLDVRASDLLQSNGIVWLEGPSDRTYFNRWVELWSDGALKEGVHYQCLFFGGALRSHLTMDMEDEYEGLGDDQPEIENVDGKVHLFGVNRNMIFLTDRDTASGEEDLPKVLRRIRDEMEESRGLWWPTHGRDIENYLTDDLLGRMYPKLTPSLGDRYERFEMVLERMKPGKGKAFLNAKAGFALRATAKMTKDDISSVPDLAVYVRKACGLIRKWNDLPELPFDSPAEAAEDLPAPSLASA